jgi:hypothetical protein
MKNKDLRAVALKYWVDNKFILKQYDTDNIFADNEINENVSDKTINDFINEYVHKTIPNTPKQKFNIGDFNSPYTLKKVNVNIDGFIKESYVVEKNNILGNVTNEPMGFLKKYLSPIEDAYNRMNSPSSYNKHFDENIVGESIAELGTAIHSTSISEGYELENIIYEEYMGSKFENINFVDMIDYVNKNINEPVLFKKVIISKKDKLKYNVNIRKKDKGINIDFIFYSNKKLYIRELKDTGNVDTQKESIMVDELDKLNLLFTNVLDLECHSGIALWGCEDVKKAKTKEKETIKYIILGRDFANSLNIDYDLIVYKRKMMNKNNTTYALGKMYETLKLAKVI